MAITYATDLTQISSADSTSAGGSWSKTGASLNPGSDAKAAVEGAGAVFLKSGSALSPTDTGLTLILSATFNATDKVFWHWRNYTTAANMDTKAALGTSLFATSNTSYTRTNFKQWALDGADTDLLGGYRSYAVDMSLAGDESNGTLDLTAVKTLMFAHRQLASVPVTNPNVFCDAMFLGTGHTITSNSAGDTLTLAALQIWDNDTTRAYGLFTSTSGIFFGTGKFTVGATGQTNAVLFKDVSKTLVWKQQIVADTFYEIKALGAAGNLTTLQWGNKGGSGATSEGCAIQVEGTAKWTLTLGANTKALGYASTFYGLQGATLTSVSEFKDSTFARCANIAVNQATLTDCLFLSPTATQLTYTALSGMVGTTGCGFTSSGTGHAIEIGGAAGSATLNGLRFNGYAATDGSTGNEAIFINIATGTVTLTLSGGTTPSIRTAGATVNVVSGATVTFTGLLPGTDVVILTAGTNTILDSFDQIPGTTYAWGYNGTPTVDVGFIKPGYKVRYLRALALGSSNSSVPVSQEFDRSYV